MVLNRIHIHYAFYATVYKNKIVAFTGKWMQLETIMLSEINQT